MPHNAEGVCLSSKMYGRPIFIKHSRFQDSKALKSSISTGPKSRSMELPSEAMSLALTVWKNQERDPILNIYFITLLTLLSIYSRYNKAHN